MALFMFFIEGYIGLFNQYRFVFGYWFDKEAQPWQEGRVGNFLAMVFGIGMGIGSAFLPSLLPLLSLLGFSALIAHCWKGTLAPVWGINNVQKAFRLGFFFHNAFNFSLLTSLVFTILGV